MILAYKIYGGIYTINVLFLNGSPRLNGQTVKLMKLIEQGLSKDITTDWVHTYNLNIKPCISCYKCRPNKKCILPEDDAQKVWNKIRSSDALIIGNPTYFGNISGTLKLLIDRNLTAFEQMPANAAEPPVPLNAGKKAIMVTTCNSPEPISNFPTQAAGTFQAMIAILNSGGYDIIGKLLLTSSPFHKDIPLDIKNTALSLGKMLSMPT